MLLLEIGTGLLVLINHKLGNARNNMMCMIEIAKYLKEMIYSEFC